MNAKNLVVPVIIIISTVILTSCSNSKQTALSGTIETSQVEAGAEVSGKVVKLYKEEGQTIKAGEAIAELDSQQYNLTVRLQEAVVKLKKAKLDEIKLLSAGSTAQTIEAAEADLEQSQIMLEQANLNLKSCTVTAPVDGVVHTNNVSFGDIVSIGTSIATITEPDKMWVNLYVPQNRLISVSLGQKTGLTCTAAKDIDIQGKITYISDKAEFTPKNVQTDEAKDNTVFRIKIEITSGKERLKPGMTVEAAL